MARRNSAEVEAPSEELEPTAAELTEAPEAPASTPADTSSEGDNTATPAEDEADLSAFEAAVNAAVASADSSTGEISTAQVEPVQTEYRALSGAKNKNRAKALLQAGVKSGMNELNIVKARAYMQLAESMTAGAAKTEHVPTDPTEAFVNQVTSLRLAEELVAANVPESVNADWNDRSAKLITELAAAATQYRAWLAADNDTRGDEPEVASVAKAAAKLSLGKSARVAKSSAGSTPYTGERRNVAAHILNAFAGVPSGTFLTVSQIRKTPSSEYGDDQPSSGAISARLFPSSGACTIEGITPGTSEAGNKGATKN